MLPFYFMDRNEPQRAEFSDLIRVDLLKID